MDQEKDQGFKVTDKRAAFREESSEPQQENAPLPDETERPAEDRQPQEQAPQPEPGAPLPEVDFMTLIFSLYTYAQMSLGVIPDPMTQQVNKDLVQAKYNIDLLAILQEKTQGNLSKEEEQALEQMLYEVRMTYVNVS